MNQLILFDYAALPLADRDFVRERTGQIREIARRTTEGVVRIGQSLIEVKERLGHGLFLRWIDTEFGWSQDTAGRFMAIAQFQGQIPQIAEYPIDLSALYILAKPSTPPVARDVLIERAAAGEHISHAEAKAVVEIAEEMEDEEPRPRRERSRSMPTPPQPPAPRERRNGSTPLTLPQRPPHLNEFYLWLRRGREIQRQFADHRELLSLASRFGVSIDPDAAVEITEFMAALCAALNADRAA